IEPQTYLTRVPIHREIPRALAAVGHQVDVVHVFPADIEFVEDGVTYHFVAPGRIARSISQVAGHLLHRDRILYEPATRAIQTVGTLHPDLIHFHGTTLNWNLFFLFLALGNHAPPIALHYHGGYPARNPLSRRIQRFNFHRAARLFFTTRTHAQPFVDASLLDGFDRVVELMETSSTFRVRARSEARRETGMAGDPVFLWVGRLHPIKDPLAALRGFEQVLAAWPDARLYLHYLTDELLPDLQAFVARRPPLARAVDFRGRAPFERMEAIYNSADFLLQASRREFSGCAVLEAMACGVIPVVTDIPSFRAMTDEGRYGVLFPPGDAEALARGVLAIPRAAIPSWSAAVRGRFERALSFPALARRLEAVYREVLQ
ncbi:MAG: glycosyltransferase family 4 protein, partial [Anaerolineae bacterium]